MFHSKSVKNELLLLLLHDRAQWEMDSIFFSVIWWSDLIFYIFCTDFWTCLRVFKQITIIITKPSCSREIWPSTPHYDTTSSSFQSKVLYLPENYITNCTFTQTPHASKIDFWAWKRATLGLQSTVSCIANPFFYYDCLYFFINQKLFSLALLLEFDKCGRKVKQRLHKTFGIQNTIGSYNLKNSWRQAIVATTTVVSSKNMSATYKSYEKNYSSVYLPVRYLEQGVHNYVCWTLLAISFAHWGKNLPFCLNCGVWAK